jgi:hypothetical protein
VIITPRGSGSLRDLSQPVLTRCALHLCTGTGSYPLPAKGLQRSTRQIESPIPTTMPRWFTASTAYSEQVGMYRQVGVRFIGEITRL